jgi:hypothetical protein
MRIAYTGSFFTVFVLANIAAAQKRLPSAEHQYVPSGFGGRAVAMAEVELALDVAGGRDKCYLYGPPDSSNWNHLWSIRPVGDAVMLVSHVDGMALDANGGAGNPYPRVADPTNINHLWILAKVGPAQYQPPLVAADSRRLDHDCFQSETAVPQSHRCFAARTGSVPSARFLRTALTTHRDAGQGFNRKHSFIPEMSICSAMGSPTPVRNQFPAPRLTVTP